LESSVTSPLYTYRGTKNLFNGCLFVCFTIGLGLCFLWQGCKTPAQNSLKITGAQVAKQDLFPQVWAVYHLGGEHLQEVCTASAIDDRTLITAAHCLDSIRNPNMISKVRSDPSQNKGLFIRKGTELIPARRYALPKDYKEGNVARDFAFLEFAPGTFTQFFDIPASKTTEVSQAGRLEGRVIGYGCNRAIDTSQLVDAEHSEIGDHLILQWQAPFSVQIFSSDDFNRMIQEDPIYGVQIPSPSYEERDLDRGAVWVSLPHSVAEDPLHVSTCFGDSGGPLLYQDKYIVGINSFIWPDPDVNPSLTVTNSAKTNLLAEENKTLIQEYRQGQIQNNFISESFRNTWSTSPNLQRELALFHRADRYVAQNHADIHTRVEQQYRIYKRLIGSMDIFKQNLNLSETQVTQKLTESPHAIFTPIAGIFQGIQHHQLNAIQTGYLANSIADMPHCVGDLCLSIYGSDLALVTNLEQQNQGLDILVPDFRFKTETQILSELRRNLPGKLPKGLQVFLPIGQIEVQDQVPVLGEFRIRYAFKAE
jgi:hypothetical protein